MLRTEQSPEQTVTFLSARSHISTWMNERTYHIYVRVLCIWAFFVIKAWSGVKPRRDGCHRLRPLQVLFAAGKYLTRCEDIFQPRTKFFFFNEMWGRIRAFLTRTFLHQCSGVRKIRYFKPKHDVFLTRAKWVLALKPHRTLRTMLSRHKIERWRLNTSNVKFQRILGLEKCTVPTFALPIWLIEEHWGNHSMKTLDRMSHSFKCNQCSIYIADKKLFVDLQIITVICQKPSESNVMSSL